jgi:hypothetical protein
MRIHWWLTLAGIAEWWPWTSASRERSEPKLIDRPEAERIGLVPVAPDPQSCGFKIPAYDVSPLFRRLALLNIDRDELAETDPLLFHELQGLCALCQSKGRCVRELGEEGDAAERQGWHEYCPNAMTLNALGALQNCSRAARHLKTPHSTRFFEGS